jgi:hypothetical protein
MKTIRILLMAAIALLGDVKCFGQSIVWNGGGDAMSWTDAQNWLGQQVPGIANNVMITNGAGTNVVISSDVSVESILCNKALTISSGSLIVTAGASSLQGALTATNGAALSASGSSTTLISDGPVIAEEANFNVSGGAVLSLPGVVSYQGGCGNVYWQASGTGSVLELTGLTRLQEPTCDDTLSIQAMSGGQVILSNVATIQAATGYVSVQADGSNSLVNLSALSTNGGALTLESSGGGSVVVSSLANSGNMSLTLNAGGDISTAQFTNINGASLYANGGALLALPGVVSYQGGCGNVYWQASGPDSVLELTGLTSLQEPTCEDTLNIQGSSGGQVILSNVVIIQADAGYVSVQADGSNSMVNLSALSTNGGALTLESSGGGGVLVPSLADSGDMSLTLNSGGLISTAQFTNINGASLYVNGEAVLSLPGVVSYQAGCATVYWQASGTGSVLDLTGLTSLQEPTCGDTLSILGLSGGQVILNKALMIQAAAGYVSVQANGSNSVVSLSALSANEGALSVEASDGGSVLVPSLAESGNMSLTLNSDGVISVEQLTNIDGASLYVSGGAVLSLPGVVSYQAGCANIYWQANGTGSVLELTALTSLQEPTCDDSLRIQGLSGGQVILSNAVTIQAAAGGAVSVQADGSNSVVNLSALSTNEGELSLEASGGGGVLVSNFATSGNMSLTLNSGGLISTAQFTNINGASLQVNGGAVLSLPGVASYQAGCPNIIWQASGTGSVLELPELTSLQEPTCEDTLNIEGSSGGQVILSNVMTIQAAAGYVSVQADGSNSLVNLSALSANGGALSLESSGGGSVLVPGLVESGSMNLTLNSGGLISTAQFTNINGASLQVNGGAVLSLPGVASYQAGCANVSWQASGAGSVLELMGLTSLQGAGCDYTLNIQALSGGQVLLGNLQSIVNGDVAFLSDDTGSIINLTSLSDFVLQTGQGSMTAENGGTILFNNQAFFLANVAINIAAAGSTPPAMLNASGMLTLYGTAWHSYRVEERNTLVPGSPVTVLLVPLTNSFETLAAAPSTNTAFLVTDFVANPAILQLEITAESEVQLVLYGLTNATYQVQTATDLRGPNIWTSGSEVVMTNAFRIFPETPLTGEQQFYRAEQQ